MRRLFSILRSYDWMLLLAAVSIAAIGLLAIYGIGVSRSTPNLFQFQKQLVALSLGVAVALGLGYVDYRHIRSLALPLGVAGSIMLIGVLIVGSSNRNGGLWFTVGAISFQPVELAKVILAIFLAAYLARHVHRRLTWIEFIGSIGATVLYMVLVLLQPDFGSAMVFIALWGSMVLFCGLPRHAWWISLLALVSVAGLLWGFGLRQYQRDRITSFINPASDPYGASYNVTQARIAIGSGGWFGKGIGEGSQARLRFLPEASTDFMFAVLGEELGFIGLCVVLSLFAFILYRMILIGFLSGDPFAALLMIGNAAVILFHLLVNAGMNLGLLPVTGIPLPFASGAASSLISVFMMIGLAESIAVRKRMEHGS